MLRIGVTLPAAPGRIGDFLPDATALEAAGADTIWLEAKAEAAEPWILLGAIAAVTHRIGLGTAAPASPAAGWVDGAHTLSRLSSGRAVVSVRPGRELKPLIAELRGFGAAPTRPTILLFCRSIGEAKQSVLLADGVILPGGGEEVRALRAQGPDVELWIDASVPADKASWVRLISSLESARATGVIVPWDPRLIDLLRGAGEPDDRSDLLIATG